MADPEDFLKQMPSARSLLSQTEQRVDKSRRFLTFLKSKLRDNDSRYNEFLSIMAQFKEHRCVPARIDIETVSKRVQDLFRANKQILIEFNKLIPLDYRIQVPHESGAPASAHYLDATQYIRRVKDETKEDPSIYTNFIEILQKYKSKAISIEEVCKEIEKLFANYTSLIESFSAFLPAYRDGESQEEDEEEVRPAGQPAKKAKSFDSLSVYSSLQSCNKYVVEDLSDPLSKNEGHFFHRLKAVLILNSPPGLDYYNELARCMDLYTTCIITKTELISLVEPLFELTDIGVFVRPAYTTIRKNANKEENHELQVYVQRQLSSLLEMFRTIMSSRETSRRKNGWFFKPLSDLDNAGCKRHGHSYIVPNKPRTTCTLRRQLGIGYLNSQWISVPYGSEDFSFKHMRKNPYEDALFKVEDERYDSDLAIEQIKYTLNLLEAALEETKRLPPDQQRDFQLDKSLFTPTKLRPIFNVYGDHGQKFRELLEHEPVRALPVIIGRLRAKLETWLASSKQEKERVWRETAEKNFSKSLDHRSFYFKQNEKKFANNKSFLNEAKGRYDHRLLASRKLGEYTETGSCDCDYEFLGGSKNKLFYSSFAGLSYGVPHFVPSEFEDELLKQSKQIPPQLNSALYANCREIGRLPQFRLLFNCQPALDDALRIMLFALDKNPPQSKDKVKKWLKALYQDFLNSPIPNDIKSGNLDEVFGPIDLEDGTTQVQVDDQKKILKKWTSGEQSDAPDSQTEDDLSNSIGDPGVDLMTLRRDVDFPCFLPLLQDSRVFFAPGSVYVFFRFLYTVYERLLKVKFILAQEYDGRGEEAQTAPVSVGEYQYSSKVETEYKNFLRTVCMVLRGTCDSAKYEDRCRQILSNDSYVLFTFDKLLNNTIKSITAITQDDQAQKAFGLYSKYRRMNATNEEMYFDEYCYMTKPPVLQAPSFRLLWNPTQRVLSVTYVESPYEKLQPQTFEAAMGYIESHLSSETEVSVPLQKELRRFQRRLDRYYVNNQMGEASFAKSIQISNSIKAGLTEGCMKLHFVPGGEDAMYSTQFLRYGKVVSFVKDEDCLYSFSDKNSFVQKMTEISEKSFKTWHEKWLAVTPQDN